MRRLFNTILSQKSVREIQARYHRLSSCTLWWYEYC
ncbi:hypothetical protein X975_18010, partial [Stegodyphus mimosarum]